MLDPLCGRISIYKRELELVFRCLDVAPVKQQLVLDGIFENAWQNVTQFTLRVEIRTVAQLRSVLERILPPSGDSVLQITNLFSLQDDLKIPEPLKRKFLANQPVALLVGAGVSTQIGIPRWNALADAAINFLQTEGLIRHVDAMAIKSEMSDPKQKLTVFHNFLEDSPSTRNSFYQNQLASRPNGKPNPYLPLCELDCIKITTNLDQHFERALENHLNNLPISFNSSEIASTPRPRRKASKSFIERDSPSVSKLSKDTIYYLHGSLDDLECVVLTTSDYIRAYYEDTSAIRKFLQGLFESHTVLFVGYGLEEFVILERINIKNGPHYVLQGVFSSSLSSFRMKASCLRNQNVISVPYFLDVDGHDRLFEVLLSWVSEIKEARSQPYYDGVAKIDEVLKGAK